MAKSPTGKYFAIEVAFQETTNSVIERKAGQAPARRNLLHAANHKVCYVIDGVGNLNFRTKAVISIMAHSDCTVAFSDSEIVKLSNYMLSVENSPQDSAHKENEPVIDILTEKS